MFSGLAWFRCCKEGAPIFYLGIVKIVVIGGLFPRSVAGLVPVLAVLPCGRGLPEKQTDNE